MQNTGFFSPTRGYFEVVGTPSVAFLEALPESTVEVPLKPGANFEWVDGAWVEGNAPPPPTAEQIRAAMPALTRMQLALVLKRAGIITAEEAKAFPPGNALPAVAVAAIASTDWPQDVKDEAEVRAFGADTMRRDNPLILLMQAAVNAQEPDRLTDEALDALWMQAAEID